MSSTIQVRIARDGKEIGTYEPAEAVRLFGLGTLKPTDHYWLSGMTRWGLLPEYIEKATSEVKPVQQKPVRVRVRKITPSQEAYLSFLGVTVSPGMSSEEASGVIDEIHSKGGYRLGWSFQRHLLYPHLYPGIPGSLIEDFKLHVKSQIVASSVKLTDAKIDKVFTSLSVKNARWWHPESRLDIAYEELKLLYPGCCDGRPIIQYGELPDVLHNYVRSRIVGCSEMLTKGKVVQVIEAICLEDRDWMNKSNRNELFWEALKQRYPGCCDGHAPDPAPTPTPEPRSSSEPPVYLSPPVSGPSVNRSVPVPQSSGCLLFIISVPAASSFFYLLFK